MNGSLSLRRPTSPFLAAWCALAALAPVGCAYSTDTHDAVESIDDVASEVTSTIRIEAEDYLTGGEGVGYHDTTLGNEGAAYRQDNVDLQATTDVGGGHGVGWTAAGEWLAYAFNAPASATYALSVRLSSHVVGTKNVHVEIDGVALPAASYTDAVGWQSWQTLSLGSRALTAGAHTIKLVADNGGVNFNYLEAAYEPPVTTIACPSGFGTEVFRDDFNGTSLDTAKWSNIQQNNGGSGEFTKLTKMLASNVTVSNGRLKVASRRYCADPYPNQNVAEHPEKCAGTNYYSGAWLKTVGNYAPGKGMMVFHAKFPAPVPGIFPALWARNTYGDLHYGELDLIETWWDMSGKGNSTNNTSLFSSTTHVVTDGWHHTNSNASPLIPNLLSSFHVWEVEWDASATPPTVRYYYRDAPGATRVLLRTVTHQTPGLSGYVTADQFKTTLSAGWRAYVDFAVQPDTAWHVGPETAQTYDPEDLEVDSVIICKP
jgi:hypothetical protein